MRSQWCWVQLPARELTSNVAAATEWASTAGSKTADCEAVSDSHCHPVSDDLAARMYQLQQPALAVQGQGQTTLWHPDVEPSSGHFKGGTPGRMQQLRLCALPMHQPVLANHHDDVH